MLNTVDWQSPKEIVHDGEAFGKFMHTLLGLYIWEWVTSLSPDWQYITLKNPFRWPLVFYFANRYFLLFAMIGIAIARNVTKEINCQALYTFNQCFGNAAIGLASINLSFRTIRVWNQKWYITVPIVLIVLGHWSLLLHGILLEAAWFPSVGCVITSTNNKLLAATFIYSMCFDLLVLCLTGWKLAFPVSAPRSRLVTLLFVDGLVFFLIAFLANFIATIFILLDLNPVMSIIANVPAAVASTIVACLAVRRLTNYASRCSEAFATTTQGSIIAFHSGAPQSGSCSKLSLQKTMDNVHVQMDTFGSVRDHSFTECDAADEVVAGDSYSEE